MDAVREGRGIYDNIRAIESDVMDKKPRPKNEGIFAGGLGIRIVLQGVMFAVLAFIGFRYGENIIGTLAGGQTMAFMVLALSQIIQAFNMRSERSLFRIGFQQSQAELGSTDLRTSDGTGSLHTCQYRIGSGKASCTFLSDRTWSGIRTACCNGNLQSHQSVST